MQVTYLDLVGEGYMGACSGNLEENWEPSQHLHLGPRKTNKTCVGMVGRRTFRILASSQHSGI
jgi:hypothetical protein